MMGFFRSLFREKTNNSNHIHVTGCETGRDSCQYYNEDKSFGDEYHPGLIFCDRYNNYVKRRDNCEYYYSYGCTNSHCMHSRKLDGRIYCTYYERYVQPQNSCPEYLDYLDSPIGRETLRKMGSTLPPTGKR